MKPPMLVEMDLGNPNTTPTWAADLTAYLRSWECNRGTARELQRIEAGYATVILDNLSGRFTPESTSSVFYPNLRPMRRIRIRSTFAATTYPIFQGFIESWTASYPGVGDDQVITVTLVDGFKVLAQAFVSGAFSQQLSSARVTAVLDAISWPAADRDIHTGQSNVPAVTLTNVSALDHLQSVAHAEGGKLFMSRDGKVTFLDRYAGTGAPSFATRTWTDDGTGMNYRDIVTPFEDDLIINDARLTRTGGTEQVATSSASQTTYGLHTFTESDVQLVADNDVRDFAQELVGRYKEPIRRIERLEDLAMRHGLWDRLLSRELQDRVLVVKHPDGADVISQDSTLQGISHSWTPDEWRTTLSVSPALNEARFIWDTSRWDIDTVWAR